MGKNQPQKLVLSRETVRDLTCQEMARIAAAAKPRSVGDGRLCLETVTGDPCFVCI